MVSQRLSRWLRAAANRLALPPAAELPPNLDPLTVELLPRVRPFTMTSAERIDALVRSVRHLERHRLPGALVECGVWRGGSMMTAALTLLRLGSTSRELYLFDTFEGMPAPTAADAKSGGPPAQEKFEQLRRSDGIGSDWCYADLPDVQRNLRSTGYPAERISFIPGLVEATVPAEAPGQIALLRLDTDWYESTRHELAQLYPRLIPGGILLIDDYGSWQGARRAVDEFLAAASSPPLLSRIDSTGLIGIKPAAT
jgi:O-methyltransferase